jgi:hypothetical protein
LETIIAEQRPKEDGAILTGEGFEVAGTDAIVHETGNGSKLMLIWCMMIHDSGTCCLWGRGRHRYRGWQKFARFDCGKNDQS